MSFSDWKKWYKALPLNCKWFVVFILLRPITDNFYSLKDISPAYSPLYIMGVLTPVFILFSFLSGRFSKTKFSTIDLPVRLLSFIIALNLLFLCIFYFSLEVVGDVLKTITPFLLFFYLRHFIRSQQDLFGILQAFLYSFIVPFGVLIYENIFSPVAVEYLSEGRGGGSRIRGGYADVMSYAIYIIGFFLISAYYYLLRIHDGKAKRMTLNKMLLVIALCLLGLISIKQVSTWAVFLALFVLFLLSSLTNRKGIILFLLVVMLILPFFAGDLYESQINPLIQKEFAVINGEKDVEYALNGRVGRWERYLSLWSEAPIVSRLFGVSLSGIKESPIMVGGGIHNDFIRMLFLSGIVGLILYVVFLILMLRARLEARMPERFLITGAVLCIVLHSMSALPTLYASYIYLLMSIFAFSALPYSAKYGLARSIKEKHKEDYNHQMDVIQASLSK